MQLLDLPSELLREILHTLDPQSFFLCLQTSKIFREHALASTSLLKDHFDRIPGTQPSEDGVLTSASLIKLFGKRASQHLLNGSGWRADVHVFGQLKRVDRKKSILVRTSWPKEDWDETYTSRGFTDVYSSLISLNVLPDESVVNVYFLESASDGRYSPSLRYVIIPPTVSQCFPLAQEDGSRLELVRVAPYTPDASMLHIEGHPGPRVGVLYRLKMPTCTDAPVLMKLLIYRLDPNFGPIIIEAFDIQCSHLQRVVSLAISDKCEAVIAWNFLSSGSKSDTLTIYTIEEDKVSLERRTMCESPIINSPLQSWPPEGISGIIIKGRSVHLHTAAYPIPQWTLPTISRTSDQIERRDTHLPLGVDDFTRPVLGIPIAHYHHHNVNERLNLDGTPSCVNTALELVVSRHLSNANTTTNWSLPPRSGAYIMKAVHCPSHCKPFSMTKDYQNLRHTYAARLVGVPDLFSLSSLGLLLAVSPKAYRVAIVSWKTVRVWAIDPRAFLEREYSLGRADPVPGDYAYTEGCGWQFYKKTEIIPGTEIDTVDLYPVDLTSAGVLHAIEFRSEDELWGWGECGLVRWNFDTHANGRKGSSPLEG